MTSILPGLRRDCVFCERLRKRECSFPFEFSPGGLELAYFEPHYPVVPGHLLVVPFTHVEDAAADPSVTGLVFRYAAQLAKARHSDFNLIVNSGPYATQTVRHLHVHIVPRVANDGLKLPWTPQQKRDGNFHINMNEHKPFVLPVPVRGRGYGGQL